MAWLVYSYAHSEEYDCLAKPLFYYIGFSVFLTLFWLFSTCFHYMRMLFYVSDWSFKFTHIHKFLGYVLLSSSPQLSSRVDDVGLFTSQSPKTATLPNPSTQY